MSIINYVERVGKYFFNLEVETPTNKWIIEKRYSEFDTLRTNLLKKFPVKLLPKLPGKTVLKVKGPKNLEKRMKGLQDFMMGLIAKLDILYSEEMKIFLELEIHQPDLIPQSPKRLLTVKDIFKLPIVSFQYLEELGYVLTGEAAPKQTTIRIFKLKIEGEVDLEAIWDVSYAQKLTTLYYNSTKNILCMGFDKGEIEIITLNMEETPFQSELVLRFTNHQGKVKGIQYLAIPNCLLSIGEDKKMIVTNYEDGAILHTIKIGDSMLTRMSYDSPNERIFLTNKQGGCFLYDVKQMPPMSFATLESEKKGIIKALEIDMDNRYVFCGLDSGFLTVFELEAYGKEGLSKQVACFELMEPIRSLAWRKDRKELIVGNKRGIMKIINTLNGQSLFSIIIHERTVKALVCLEEHNLLITASRDKTVSIYHIPSKWFEGEEDLGKQGMMTMSAPKVPLIIRDEATEDPVKDSGDSPTTKGVGATWVPPPEPQGGYAKKYEEKKKVERDADEEEDEDDLMGWNG